MPGDQIVSDDDLVWEVREAEQIENPDDPDMWDWVRVVLSGPGGDRVEEAPAGAGFARVIGS